MRRSASLLLILAFLGTVLGVLALGGCEKTQTIGGKPRPRNYSRVVSLSPSTSEILVSNGVRIVGRTSSCDYPQGIASAPVVAGVKPDYEALARIKPDLIVYDKQLYNDADVQKIKSLGAETFEYDPHTFSDYEKQVYALGSLAAVETNISDYVKRVRQAAANAAESGNGLKVAIVLPDASGRHMIAGSRGFLSEVVATSGAKLVGPEGDRFVPLDPEAMIGLNPDLVIVAGEPNAFAGDKRFANLAAMKNNAVYGLDQNIVLRRGARVDVLVRNISKAAGLVLASRAKGNSGTLPR